MQKREKLEKSLRLQFRLVWYIYKSSEASSLTSEWQQIISYFSKESISNIISLYILESGNKTVCNEDLLQWLIDNPFHAINALNQCLEDSPSDHLINVNDLKTSLETVKLNIAARKYLLDKKNQYLTLDLEEYYLMVGKFMVYPIIASLDVYDKTGQNLDSFNIYSDSNIDELLMKKLPNSSPTRLANVTAAFQKLINNPPCSHNNSVKLWSNFIRSTISFQLNEEKLEELGLKGETKI